MDERQQITERNRQNSLKSTGPKTAEGKRRASQNSIKHGIRSQKLVLPGEIKEEVEILAAQAQRELSLPGRIGEEIANSFALLVQQEKRLQKHLKSLADEKLLEAENPHSYSETAVIRMLEEHIEALEGILDLWENENFHDATAVRELIDFLKKFFKILEDQTKETSPISNYIVRLEVHTESMLNAQAPAFLKKISEAAVKHIEFLKELHALYSERREKKVAIAVAQAEIPNFEEMKRIDKYRTSNENSLLRKLEMAEKLKKLVKQDRA